MFLTPNEAMKLAIEEGKRGAGFVSPNPLVGCVILGREGNLIGKGHHARVGEGHAEVNALESVQDKTQLDGAQLFV
ncbi:MAG: bifunctional diaminohydroxyphosphoribosylaminopyrimidine deaminase/5-amino-6-(5-phosphoribosylamino)uracil reductase RibD, partial [Bdellovibrionales bacterium]